MPHTYIGAGLKCALIETCEIMKGIDYKRGIFLTNLGLKLRQCSNLCYTMSVILNQCLNRPKIRRVTWEKRRNWWVKSNAVLRFGIEPNILMNDDSKTEVVNAGEFAVEADEAGTTGVEAQSEGAEDLGADASINQTTEQETILACEETPVEGDAEVGTSEEGDLSEVSTETEDTSSTEPADAEATEDSGGESIRR